MRDAIHALLEFFASEPMFTRLAFIDGPIAQPATARRTNEHVRDYARIIFHAAPNLNQPLAIAPEIIVYGLFEIIYRYAATDQISALPQAAAEATYLALAPFLGGAQAASQ
jgi:hypothetical protein